jgi:hypothetical protein
VKPSHLLPSASISLVGACLASRVFAQGTDVAAAESLFREGKRLLEQRSYDAACSKLAESHRLDPATGTLLALAMCHEGAGKTASAWAEYSDVVGRAKKEGRADRERAAREEVALLEPKLSKLTVTVSGAAAGTAGLEVKRDGVLVGVASWGTPMPTDAGEHVVQASAPGKKTWETRVALGPNADRVVVNVPLLENGSLPADRDAPAAHTGLSAVQTAGLSAGAAGVLAIGIGSYFGLRAISKKQDAGCDGDACHDATSAETLLDAKSASKVSTWSFVAGGALLAGGAAMYLLGGSAPASAARSVQAVPAAGDGALGVFVHGRF